MFTRREFLRSSGAALLGASMVSRVQAASLPEAPIQASPLTQPPLAPAEGRPYNPVVTLNGWTLPWRTKNGVKEFHLVAEPVVREIAPGMRANLWGYNGQSPGPTIEVVEGDKVRLFVTNRLPEHTSIHWHGQRLPNGMDGVAGLTQPAIQPGKTFVYEFIAKRPGTFMYHPHADEMTQMAMGMMGSWVTHPKEPDLYSIDRDFVFLLNAYDVEPGSFTPKTSTMLEFNIWTFNSRAFPGIDPLIVRKGDRVRIRIGNLTMTNHPIHLHGHEFEVAGTDGGWVPKSARWPEVTTDIAIGQMRAIEFDATDPGDWALHCHKSHHTMNAMGHNVPTMIGVDQRGVAEKIRKLIPDYMLMGDTGGSMGEMEMALPDNTLPMMTGQGPFGGVEMGGMFTMVKIREGLARNDYQDPGWYQQPPGTAAYEWTGEPLTSIRAPGLEKMVSRSGETVLKVMKGGRMVRTDLRKPARIFGSTGQSNVVLGRHLSMKSRLIVSTIALSLTVTGALAHGDEHEAGKEAKQGEGHANALGRPGDPMKISRTIDVEMSDAMRFSPANIKVKRGETIKFVLTNAGKVKHEMVLGSIKELKAHAALMQKFPEMEHADPNMVSVEPGKTGELVWQFTKAGTFDFACLQPGHFEAGMVGKVAVKR